MANQTVHSCPSRSGAPDTCVAAGSKDVIGLPILSVAHLRILLQRTDDGRPVEAQRDVVALLQKPNLRGFEAIQRDQAANHELSSEALLPAWLLPVPGLYTAFGIDALVLPQATRHGVSQIVPGHHGEPLGCLLHRIGTAGPVSGRQHWEGSHRTPICAKPWSRDLVQRCR